MKTAFSAVSFPAFFIAAAVEHMNLLKGIEN